MGWWIRLAGVLLLAGTQAAWAQVQFGGTVGFSISGDTVVLSADRIENTSSNTTTGSLQLQLIATFDPSPTGIFYRLGNAELSALPNQFPVGNGRLPPGGAFTGVEISTPFTSPPDGLYFYHLVLTQFDSSAQNNGLDTFLDSVTFDDPVRTGGAPPPIDQFGNGFDSAGAVALNATVSAAINTGGDVDFFRLEVPAAGSLTVSSTGNLDTVGTLFDGNRQELVSNDDGSSFNFVISEPVTAGTYFVRVAHFDPRGTGNYTFVTQFVAAEGSFARDAGATGIFFDPDSSGQGFNFNYGDNGLTVFFYGHGQSGGNLWLVSETLDVDLQFGVSVRLEVFELPGGTFGSPDAQTLGTWGTLTLTFNSCDEVVAVLEGLDGTQTLSLQRLSGVEGVACD